MNCLDAVSQRRDSDHRVAGYGEHTERNGVAIAPPPHVGAVDGGGLADNRDGSEGGELRFGIQARPVGCVR